ncbi:zinc-binding dehydrogenase [Nonomuraea sp. CA-141351]|uniref:zinc-binding dehydrogenase n=1 Tax=Nonomuraea sp. CA-141351 TaxID=3239996 RepID=UPI003D922E9B
MSPRALQRRSVTVSGFWLMDALARAATLGKAYMEMSAQVAAGELRVVHGGDYPMSEVRRAHDDLSSRRTIGKLVIDPHR